MERFFAFLLLFGSGTAAGAGLFQMRDYDPPSYPESRAPFVIQLAKQFGDADTLVLGDSLIEQTDLAGACGRTFNGGIGGSRIQNVREAMPALMNATTPERVVIAVGSNHFAAGDEIDDFRDYYPELLTDIIQRGMSGQDMILVGVANSPAASREVEAAAREIGATYVAPVAGQVKDDGLHHTVAGSRAYREAIRLGCDRSAQSGISAGGLTRAAPCLPGQIKG